MTTSKRIVSPPSPDVHADPAASARSAGLRHVTDDSPGFTRRSKQTKGKGVAFAYFDTEGKPLRDAEQVARINALAIPPAYTDVWICPQPDGHLQATGRDAKGRKQYRYHPRWRTVRDDNKYERMMAFAAALPGIRRHIDADLSRLGLPREKVLATVVRLLETTLIRVGNDEYAKSNKSFGLTTMRDKHVKLGRKSIRFEFRGKSGVSHEIDLADARLARIVAQCRDLPGQELFQYLDEEGIARDIDSADVNAYLQEVSGRDFTAKDFRTWAGTVLASLALQEFGRSTRRPKPRRTSSRRSSMYRHDWATPRRSAGSATSTPRSCCPTSTGRCSPPSANAPKPRSPTGSPTSAPKKRRSWPCSSGASVRGQRPPPERRSRIAASLTHLIAVIPLATRPALG